jgi:hypothetical protein
MAVEWIFAALLLSSLCYASMALAAWPYARPAVPLWLLVLAVLLPPFFPLLLLFVLTRPVVVPQAVLVVERRSGERV